MMPLSSEVIYLSSDSLEQSQDQNPLQGSKARLSDAIPGKIFSY